MKVGLIRHFKVIHPVKKTFMTSEEFQKWQDGYNTADIEENIIKMDSTEWQICYSSDLLRAKKTAQTVYSGNIIETELLREIDISPVVNTKMRLPFMLWTVLGRSAWFFSHKSQKEKHIDTQKRADVFVSKILANGETNILIVSHGALMWYIRKALLSRGFTGPNFTKAKNGYLYVFEKNG